MTDFGSPQTPPVDPYNKLGGLGVPDAWADWYEQLDDLSDVALGHPAAVSSPAAVSIPCGRGVASDAAAPGPTDASQQPDWIEFLHWLTACRHLTGHDVADVVEKPRKWAQEYLEFQADPDRQAA